jgi:hypothetical protein
MTAAFSDASGAAAAAFADLAGGAKAADEPQEVAIISDSCWPPPVLDDELRRLVGETALGRRVLEGRGER